MISIKKTLSALASHICIEQGTSGIWTYKKYADGTAECWGKLTVINTQTTHRDWGSLHVYEVNSNIQYPFAFIETPVLNVTWNDSDYSGGFMTSWATGSSTKTHTGQFGIGRGTIDTKVFGEICYHAIGRWK